MRVPMKPAGKGGQPLGSPLFMSSLCTNSCTTTLWPRAVFSVALATCSQLSMMGPRSMASPSSTCVCSCTTPASSTVWRRATASPGCSTMVTKSSYQSSALAGSPQCSSGRQAWAAMSMAMASVTTRPCAPWNCLWCRNNALMARSLDWSCSDKAAKNG
ncbi:hypothetical protein D3C72_1523410 [compost metagenome]